MLDWIFIHVPMRLMLVVLFTVDLLDNGFIVMGWEARDEARYAKYSLQAVAAIAAVNVVGLIIVAVKRDLGESRRLEAPTSAFSLLPRFEDDYLADTTRSTCAC